MWRGRFVQGQTAIQPARLILASAIV